ncbi:MAG: FKBP-type peptidyl-prolyl cis-trans isomerase [Syntrophorhabdaceae bacterium]|nr:FKBP-type peptidyl-prolyl cis-trans isomerase [Syntrophorhabdaceae bacterium]MDD5243726.1 FKBP-type peptidyl-prolyl cis-trans isomerase [Syntrophorhabdaceae bacterium]
MRLKETLKWMVVILGVIFFSLQAGAEEIQSLKTQKDKISYGIGVDMAENFKRLGMDLDLDILIKGLRDAYSNGKLLMTEDDLRATLNAYQNELMQKQVQTTRVVAEQNKKEGDAFLAQNKTKEGVVTLPSGLQYKIIKEGSGRKPTNADSVECHYRGTLINGTEFDSSYRRGQPATFKVAGVIPGWTEALKLMPVGSKWQLFIPPQLAYGERGAGRNIGPNTTLIFEIELLSIK